MKAIGLLTPDRALYGPDMDSCGLLGPMGRGKMGGIVGFPPARVEGRRLKCYNSFNPQLKENWASPRVYLPPIRKDAQADEPDK